jgi:hypothetical protein
LAYVNKGTLTLEVRIRLQRDEYCYTDNPKSNIGDDLLKLYLEENREDVAFRVKRKIVKSHRIILRARAPELAELSETYDVNNPMPIDDVKPEVFELMIGTLYGKRISAQTWKKQSKFILQAAGKYGFGDLCTEASAWYLKLLDLDVSNAVDTLMYADGNSLTLVKEAALKYISENSGKVLASDSFRLLQESPALMAEVMQALSNRVEVLSENQKRRRLK